MYIKMTLDEFTDMLDRLHCSHIVERINDSIVHVKIIKNNDMLRMRFVDYSFFGDAICFEFNDIIE